SAGYEVEIDLRYICDKFYLGHDTPDYEVSETWLKLRKEKLWIHCKDLDSANKLIEIGGFMFFCHNSDPYVLTSNKFIWVHDLTRNLSSKSTIIPLLNIQDIDDYNKDVVYAVCSDYVLHAENQLKKKGLC
ncbi:MAG: hypothetical protein ACK5OW_01980, partial [bacterium]